MLARERLFAEDNPLAIRPPKTDRLILDRYLKNMALLDPEIDRAHPILIKWADLESSGQLTQMQETQLQGEFLGDVFGNALGYTLFSKGLGKWTLQQHVTINGGTPDAVLGNFRAGIPPEPAAVVELKGPNFHLDRDRSQGRTAVQQCWNYLNNTPPTCRWGIVSNMVSFRLYERNSTPRRFEHFSLQSLRDRETFRRFYLLFEQRGLISTLPNVTPRTEELLQRSNERQREVGEELYSLYSTHRVELVAHLHHEKKHPLDEAIEIVQRLLDRVIFIAFCEDRDLLPKDTLKNAHEKLPAFTAITNPRWQNFKNLFRFVDEGNDEQGISKYNGGLFARSKADDLELDDKWTQFFATVGTYHFAQEVNLDVLGHLFEQSITELEKLRTIGLFGGDAAKVEQYARMPQSAKRKQMGIYYTPPELTSRIVEYTVDELIHQRFAAAAIRHGVPEDQADLQAPDSLDYWRECLDILRNLKIVDPACGSGAFLFQAYEVLDHRYAEVINHLIRLGDRDASKLLEQVPQFILNDNLYGVDLSREAVEITQLALWIRSATPGHTLATLSRNIVHGNSLVHDPAVHPAGFDWRKRFPEVFQRAGSSSTPAAQNGFDCVIGNPPWERIKLQEREFFSLPAPQIATADNAAKRRKMVAKLESDDPALFQRYQEALASAESLSTYCRASDQYPLTGKGDINLYAVFAELASQIVAPAGRVGLLTPSGIASDNTTKDFFAALTDNNRLIRLYDFENRTKQFFPDVDGRFKFCILNFSGESPGIAIPGRSSRTADFIFFAHKIEDLEDKQRRIKLSAADIKLLNPNTRTCPIFRTRRDAEITKAIYRRVPVLIDKSREKTGNPWGIKFKTMFHQTNDAELFHEAAELKKKGFKLVGNRWVKESKRAGSSSTPAPKVFLPLYEAKMVQAYDHRAASVITEQNNWVRQGQTDKTTLVEHQNPEHVILPRFWVSGSDVVDDVEPPGFLGFKDITSPTNQRTMIGGFIPLSGVTNHFVLVNTETSELRKCCLLANFNSYAWDFTVRQKIGGVTLNFFIVEQVPTLPPDEYNAKCPWDRKKTFEQWISERVLKLTCTAEDMLPLAEACNFKSGSFKKEYGGKLHKWNPQERAQLMAELDACYFILYGIDREDAGYILSTFSGTTEADPLLPGHVSTADHILNTYDYFKSHF